MIGAEITADTLVPAQAPRGDTMTFAAGSTILPAGIASGHVYLLDEGWAFRYGLLPDGRRQIVSFRLAGDVMGLQSALLGTTQFGVDALTDCVTRRIAVSSLLDAHDGMPQAARQVMRYAALELTMADNRLLSVGRHAAVERIAFFLLDLSRRLDALEGGQCDVYPLPLRQQHIADAAGLSLVHTNKSLRQLTRMGLVAIEKGQLRILDRRGLQRFVGIQPLRLTSRRDH